MLVSNSTDLATVFESIQNSSVDNNIMAMNASQFYDLVVDFTTYL